MITRIPKTDPELAAEIEAMPGWLRLPLEFEAAETVAVLRRLRMARFMATIESGEGRGSVDRDELARYRALYGLDAARIRRMRRAYREEIDGRIGFAERARRAGACPRAVRRHLREAERARLINDPQMPYRGAGYYPGPGERIEARKAEARYARACREAYRELAPTAWTR
jgi:hypothetical protein